MSWESTTTAVLHPRRTACQECGAVNAARHTERGWKTPNGSRWLCADCANAARMTAQGIATNRQFSGEGNDDLLGPTPKCARCGWRSRKNKQYNDDGIPLAGGALTLCVGCAALAREKAKNRRKAQTAPASPIRRQAITHDVPAERIQLGQCECRLTPKKKATPERDPLLPKPEPKIDLNKPPCPHRAVVLHDGRRYCDAHAAAHGIPRPAYFGRKRLVRPD